MCSSSSSNQSQKLSSVQQHQKHWRPWERDQSQSAPPLKCKLDMCNATFKRDSELKRHTLSKHIKKREICKVCRKVFTRKDNLTRHYKLAHNGDEKPCCKFCYKILSRRDAVQRHESTCPKNPSRRTVRQSTEFVPASHLERLQMKYPSLSSKAETKEETP